MKRRLPQGHSVFVVVQGRRIDIYAIRIWCWTFIAGDRYLPRSGLRIAGLVGRIKSERIVEVGAVGARIVGEGVGHDIRAVHFLA